MEENRFAVRDLHLAFNQAYARPLDAQIYSLLKTHVDMWIYITDTSGKVVFDSKHPQNEGEDYSLWRDVYSTLKGKEYRARTTQLSPEDPFSPAVLYVPAPIMVRGEVVGVLTVAKPTTNINTFLKIARPQILKVGLMFGAIAIMLSYLVSRWLTQPIMRLTDYANDIRSGKRATFPRLDRSEIGEMGSAFRKMQEALEGKKYVEQYVQNLTHEIKSPLSAIRGAAELLDEQMPPKRRTRFLKNIRDEANRIQMIVNRMLELASLENRDGLEDRETVVLSKLMNTFLESKRPLLSKKQLRVHIDIPQTLTVQGDGFLLHQAISNLVQNALEFSPTQGELFLKAVIDDQQIRLSIEDQGVGIPDYALERIFEKFFSLQRPDNGKKSTGLGLNFVKEVALLHGGDVTLENRENQGARATLILPKA
jgi:two-component system sensor histidine kinase CreC